MKREKEGEEKERVRMRESDERKWWDNDLCNSVEVVGALE